MRGLFNYVLVIGFGLLAFFLSLLPTCVPTCSLLHYSVLLPNVLGAALAFALSLDMLSRSTRSKSAQRGPFSQVSCASSCWSARCGCVVLILLVAHCISSVPMSAQTTPFGLQYKAPLAIIQLSAVIAQGLSAVERLTAMPATSLTGAMVVHEIARALLLAAIPNLYIILRTQYDDKLTGADGAGVCLWSLITTGALFFILATFLPRTADDPWKLFLVAASGVGGLTSTLTLLAVCVSIWRQRGSRYIQDLDELPEEEV
jgi:hypothetical protein